MRGIFSDVNVSCIRLLNNNAKILPILGFLFSYSQSRLILSLPIARDTHSAEQTQSVRLPLSIRGQRISQDAQNLQQFPFELWQRYVGRHTRNPKLTWQAYPQQGGHPDLRAAIAEYVRISHGIQCHAAQVLITHGAQTSLQLAAHLLADPNDFASRKAGIIASPLM